MKREKLTLRLEEGLIVRAKKIGRERGTSVSRMVAGYFASIEEPVPGGRRHGDITRRLRGSIRPKDGASADEEDYRRRLERKHG